MHARAPIPWFAGIRDILRYELHDQWSTSKFVIAVRL
jgi:hypothetical protein